MHIAPYQSFHRTAIDIVKFQSQLEQKRILFVMFPTPPISGNCLHMLCLQNNFLLSPEFFMLRLSPFSSVKWCHQIFSCRARAGDSTRTTSEHLLQALLLDGGQRSTLPDYLTESFSPGESAEKRKMRSLAQLGLFVTAISINRFMLNISPRRVTLLTKPAHKIPDRIRSADFMPPFISAPLIGRLFSATHFPKPNRFAETCCDT